MSKPCGASSWDQLSRGSSARVFSSSSLTAAPNARRQGQLGGSRCGAWSASRLRVSQLRGTLGAWPGPSRSPLETPSSWPQFGGEAGL